MTEPKLWITYAWVDNERGDFSALVQDLKDMGVTAQYDRVVLVPGHHLWDQIAEQISEPSVAGWAYLVTPASLKSQACKEELAYALDRALRTRGKTFPLIGLIQTGIRIEDVPAPLRVRLCISLGSRTWREEVLAALKGVPPEISPAPTTRFSWSTHRGFDGDSNASVVEVHPRFGDLVGWRFMVPESADVLQWGHGMSGGKGPLSGMQVSVVEGTVEIDGQSMRFFGSGDHLSPSVSAYAVFSGTLPDRIGFGVAEDQFGIPSQWEMVGPGRLPPVTE